MIQFINCIRIMLLGLTMAKKDLRNGSLVQFFLVYVFSYFVTLSMVRFFLHTKFSGNLVAQVLVIAFATVVYILTWASGAILLIFSFIKNFWNQPFFYLYHRMYRIIHDTVFFVSMTYCLGNNDQPLYDFSLQIIRILISLLFFSVTHDYCERYQLFRYWWQRYVFTFLFFIFYLDYWIDPSLNVTSNQFFYIGFLF